MPRSPKTKTNRRLDREIDATLKRFSIKKAQRHGVPGFTVFGRDEFDLDVDFFVHTKGAAIAIRDLYQEGLPLTERSPQVERILRDDTRLTAQETHGPPASSAHSAQVDEQTALKITRQAVQSVPAEGRFGDDKVFISAVYDRIAPQLGWSLNKFKQWLLRANRDQLIDLARADAQGDMDPDLVARSEIINLGAAFHFLIDASRLFKHRN